MVQLTWNELEEKVKEWKEEFQKENSKLYSLGDYWAAERKYVRHKVYTYLAGSKKDGKS